MENEDIHSKTREVPTAEDLVGRSEIGAADATEKIKKRKEKITTWFRDPYNFIFFAILIFAFAIRIYYLNLTKTQPLWSDEADYMAYAKNLAGYSTYYVVNAAHSSIFPNIASFFLRLTASETIVKFFIEVIPSFFLVFLTYKIILLMYDDKKIALISCFLMATVGEILFNTYRFHVDIPSLFFIFLAIYIFWQGYEKNQKIFGKLSPNFAMPLVAVLILLAYVTRRGYFIAGLFFLIYILLTKSLKLTIKNKYNWIALVVFFILFFLFEKVILVANIGEVASLYSHSDLPANWSALKIFRAFFINIFNPNQSILLYLFYLGLILIIVDVILHLGYIKKTNSPRIKSNIFILISIAVVLSYFIFYQRDPPLGEPRWYFPILFGALISISQGTIFLTDFIKKYNRQLAVLAIILLIGFGGYYELKYADKIIKIKKDTYNGVKQAGLFVKENSNKGDEVFVLPDAQGAYYSERKSWNLMKLSKEIPKIYDLEQNFSANRFTFDIFLESLRNHPDIRFVVITFTEPHHPNWMRTEEYAQTPQGVQYSKWVIPFMDTTIDFINNKQDIKQTKSYEEFRFEFRGIKEDAFIYEIIRNQSNINLNNLIVDEK